MDKTPRAGRPRDLVMFAKGSFEVKVTTEPPIEDIDGVTIARTTVDKTFAGPLDATSKVHMLGVQTKVKGSAAYAAVERVQGALEGRRGSFVVVHAASMQGGKFELRLPIAPDSGTGELSGIAGQMTIEIVEGKHLYTIDYRLGR